MRPPGVTVATRGSSTLQPDAHSFTKPSAKTSSAFSWVVPPGESAGGTPAIRNAAGRGAGAVGDRALLAVARQDGQAQTEHVSPPEGPCRHSSGGWSHPGRVVSSADGWRKIHPMSEGFRSHPDPSTWDDYVDFESTSWPKKERRRYWIIPSICFNCESACGILAYVDKETLDVRKIEGNPCIPGAGRTCAKGVVTPNQPEDPDRIMYPLRRTGRRGEGLWEQVSRNEALEDIGGRIRKAIVEGRRMELDLLCRPPGRGRRREPGPRGLGRRWGQQRHERLLVVGATRTLPLVWC